MTTTFEKDPSAVLDYSVDWTDFLQTAETIATSTWVVPSGITKDSDSTEDKITTIWLSGGTVNKSYELINRITTDNAPARIDERTMIICIVNK
jgi:hypothetical protein